MSRPNKGTISRDTSYSTEAIPQPSWADEYLAAVEKYSTKSRKEDSALFDQINKILGNSKSKYSSVEEAVLDMQKRTGLFDLINKVASDQQPELFSKLPSLKHFIDNHIETYPGTSMFAVVDNMIKIPEFKDAIPSGEDVPQDVKNYINAKIGELNPHEPDMGDKNLGKTDVETTNEIMKDNNPLNILTPSSM